MGHRKMFSIILVFSLVLSMVIVGCGEQESSDIEPGPDGEKETVDHITVTCGATGGSWYPIGTAVAELLNQVLPGYPATAVPGGGTANPPMVAEGKADVGLSYSSTLNALTQGKDPFDKPNDNVAGIALLYDMYYHLAVAEDLGIDSLKEIKEKQLAVRWVPNLPGTGCEWLASKVMEAYGFNYDDIAAWGGKMEFSSMSDAVSLWRDRHVNIYSAHTLPPQPTFTEVSMARPTKFISLEDDIREYLSDKYATKNVVIPAGIYQGQDDDVTTVGMPCVLFVRKDLPEEIAYLLTKQVMENKEYLISVHSLFEEFEPSHAWDGLGIPLHPGAERYYKEVGFMPN